MNPMAETKHQSDEAPHVHNFQQVEGQSALECECGETPDYDAPQLQGPSDVPVSCTWTLEPNPDYEVWESDCGEGFQFTDEGPIANRMKFCCYCGKPLIEKIVKVQYGDD